MPDSSTSPKTSVKVSIMQREFTVACPEGETDELIAAAAYLDQQMCDISDNSRTLGMDRCAVLAGLNICHQLLQLQKTVAGQENATQRLENLHQKVDRFVTRQQ